MDSTGNTTDDGGSLEGAPAPSFDFFAPGPVPEATVRTTPRPDFATAPVEDGAATAGMSFAPHATPPAVPPSPRAPVPEAVAPEAVAPEAVAPEAVAPAPPVSLHEVPAADTPAAVGIAPVVEVAAEPAAPTLALAEPVQEPAPLVALVAEPAAEVPLSEMSAPELAAELAAPQVAATPGFTAEMLREMEAAQAAGPPAPEPAAVGLGEAEVGEHGSGRGSTEDAGHDNDVNLQELLMEMVARGASDLHLASGSRPMIRRNGGLEPMEEYPDLTPPVIQRVLYAAITQQQREKFEENLELDFAYSVPGRARFRVNVYRQRDALGAAFRLIPYEIKPLESLGVPPSVANFSMLPRGFVLVTGPTGSGKSTTLAAIVDLANRNRRDHILTVEDPIEFLHRHQGCLVNQREVGEDTHSFANALKHALRQDPDIILVGEMRDLETISVALTAAETGHLVFGTLHTSDAAQTIDRVIDVFPPHQQQQVRVQLAGALQGVVCQTLCKTADGKGRAVATEVLVVTPAIRNLIREGKTHQIYSAMQAGAQHGMHTLDQHLADLVNRGRVTYEVGLEKCHHVEDFNRLTGRG